MAHELSREDLPAEEQFSIRFFEEQQSLVRRQTGDGRILLPRRLSQLQRAPGQLRLIFQL